MKIEQIEDPGLAQCDVSFSHVTLLQPSFCINGFHYSHGQLSVTFHPGVIADDLITTLTSA